MSLPRFRITYLLVFVALVAVDFEAIRLLYPLGPHSTLVSPRAEVLTYVVLPSANLLAFGAVISLKCPGARRFMWGFEVFGVTALAFLVVFAYFHAGEIQRDYILRIFTVRTMVTYFGPGTRLPVYYAVATLLVGLPQAAFALIGGVLFHCYSRLAI